MIDRFTLPGARVALIGSARGIGFSSALLLKEAGAKLILIDRDTEGLAQAAEALGSDCVLASFQMDLADAEGIRQVFSKIAALGELDVLINCAGINGHVGPLESTPLDSFDTVFAINSRGPFLAMQEAVEIMRRNGTKGSIVNLSSTAGLVGSSRLGAYAMSKAAMCSMTRSLALSVAKDGIRVNAICPGSIDTSLFAEVVNPAEREADLARIAAVHPLGRIGEVEEVAAAVLFLASPASSFITGVLLPVDGGRTA